MLLQNIIILFLQTFGHSQPEKYRSFKTLSEQLANREKRAISRFMLKQMIDKDPFLFI